jgi:RHS repeat-associated protein
MTAETDGLDGTCATVAGQTRTVTASLDGLGRTYRQEITSGPNTGDRTQDDTFDAVGNHRTIATKTSGVTSTTTFTINLLDQVLAEARPDGSTAKTNFDATGNSTDRCVWTAGLTVGACLASGTTPWTNPPATAASTAYDARNQRLSLTIGTTSGTISTTTYNPAAGYQVAATYLPTGTGKEYQTLYSYDVRQRLSGITNQLCVISSGHSCSSTTALGSDVYAYDDNDSRTQVNESNGATSANRYYCYDAANRLLYRNTGAACSSSAKDESNTYDATGNRTQTLSGGTTTNFAYDANGQLCKVGATSCTSPNVTYDSAGRTATYNGWAFLYDAEGRLTSACQSTSCTGSGFNRVDDTYDGQGHRTTIVETTSGGAATTTTFTYQGDAIASETASSGLTRAFVTDEGGRIVKVTITGDSNSNDNATFLVAWNGHGDALGLWRQNADGSVTLANSYTYSTWGAPTTTVASPFSDLGFRYLYVGASDVQSDNTFSLGLLYMHARHYAPALGRFLQPDPARSDGGLYGYATDNPIRDTDPTGTNSLEAYYPFKPNALERMYCALFPAQCSAWKLASAWAVWYGAQAPDREAFNALRHCIWQCLMTYSMGWDWARFWGTIHEVGSPPTTERQKKDRSVDLHNNYVGRLLGSHLGEMGALKAREADKLCVGAWNWGYLWTYAYGRIRWSNGSEVSGVYDHWYP